MNKLIFTSLLACLTMGIWSQQSLKKFMKTHKMDLCPTTQKTDSASLMANVILLKQYISENKNFDPEAYYLIGMEYFKIAGNSDTSNTFKYYRLYLHHPKSKDKASAWWNMALSCTLLKTKDCTKAIEYFK